MSPVGTADGGKASKKTKVESKDSKEKAATKLCYIVKRANFDGYGFNLQTEKSRPGQYIGKVDENSPAEAAGLREGYRVIEVNGIPVNNETHKQVVQRIKAIAWEVKLLVATEITDNDLKQTTKSLQNNITVNSDNESNIGGDSVIDKVSNSGKNLQNSNDTSVSMTAVIPAANKNIHIIETNNQVKSQSDLKTTSPTPTSNAGSPRAEHDASSQNTQKPHSSLKLPSTAAEMRAILQSKKKFNPKCEDVDLQKKHDIIQKL